MEEHVFFRNARYWRNLIVLNTELGLADHQACEAFPIVKCKLVMNRYAAVERKVMLEVIFKKGI